MKHFVELLTNPGDTVLDPFMGSGTSGVASIIENRSFTGVEINKDYFNLAYNRLCQKI